MLQPLLILIGVFIVTQALVTEKSCKSNFGKNQKQLFRFTGIVENGIAGTTNNVTKMKIEADVTILNWNSCKFYLQLSKVTFRQSLAESENEKFEALPAHDLANRLTKHPLLFYMNEGHVVKIQPSVESTQPDVLNIQRGILSMLQVKKVNDISNVKDVSGNCKTIYSIVKDKKSILDKNILYIKKVKDLQTCNHEITHSNIIGNPYSFSGGMKGFNEGANFEQSQSSILESNSHCFYKFDVKSHAQVIDIQCEEKFLVKAFSSDNKAGAYVKSRSFMVMVSNEKIFSWIDVYTNLYDASIKYDHNHQHTPSKVPSAVKVSNLLDTLSKKHFSESKFDSAEKFFDFVASLRQLTSTEISSILQSVEMDKSSVRSFLLDGLAQCGTHECLTMLFGAIQKNVQLQKEASRFMPYIAFIKEPSPEIIRLLMGIHQQTKNPSMLLALTTLVYKLCIHRSVECSTSGDIGKVVEDVEYYLLRLLGNNCQVTNNDVINDIYFALKGIGNIGRSVKALPLIMDCIRNAKHSNVSIAAIQSIRKMKIPDSFIENLREILADKNEDFEKRAEILLLLMKDPSRDDIILAIDLANDQDESGQIKSFIASFLKSAASNEDPTKQKLKSLFKQTVEQYPLIDFNPSAYQYSKFIQKSANIFQTSAAIDAMILYHPESFVPRALRLNFTTHMLGFSVNALEINARLDGLEEVMQKYFGGNENSDSYFSKAFKLPNVELHKKRRDVKPSYFEELDNMVNMRKSVPQASIDFKIFNNDIHTFNNEDMPFLNGQWDDFNIIKELYELTKGKKNTFKQNMILLEASHSVPTILGLPLKIGVNGSSVVSFDMKVKLSTQNILFGSKSATVDVYLNPSVSTHVSAKLNIECIGVGEIGTSFKMDLHATKKISAKAEYVEGEEFKVDFDAEQQVNDLFNVSYNMFHVLTGKEETLKGIEKRSSVDICLDDIISSSEIFGSDTCIMLSFPNGYYNQSMPYFPLTGPVQLGVTNYPKDSLLKKYSFHLVKHASLYDLTISTPGSSIKRNYLISLGLKYSEDHGIVAISFGEKRKGISLKYKFNNITNELETSMDCNFTNTPFSLFMRYFNESDQATLKKAIGEEINFNFGEYYIKHSSFYNSNYDFWALGTKTEYSPGKVIAGNLKIQYNPQVLTLELSHPTTNSLVSGYFSPSLPYLIGELNITHGISIDIKGSGKIDIANYKVEGTVNAGPFNQHITAVGVWNPGDKIMTLDAKVNENPITWKANLATMDGLNYASSLLQMSKMVLKNNISWNNKVFNSDMYVAEKRLFQVAGNIEKYSDGINLFVSSYIEDSLSEFNMRFKNSSSLQEVSVDGVFLNKVYGYSLSSHVEEFSNTFSFKVLSKDGVLEEFILLNHSRSESTTTVFKIVDHTYISLIKSKQKLECTGQLYGTHLSLVKHLMENHEKTSVMMSYPYSQRFDQVYNSTFSYQTSLNSDNENIFFSIQSDHFNYNVSYDFNKNTSRLNAQLFNRTRYSEEDLTETNFQSDNTISLPSHEVVTFWWEDSTLKKVELKTQPIGILSLELNLNENIVKIKPNDLSLFEPLLVFKVEQDNSIYFKIMKENYFFNNMFSLYENDITNVKIITSTIFGQLAEQLINKLGISKEKKILMVDNFKSSAFMYFTNLECNGKDVYKQYLSHTITEDKITDFVLRLLYDSYSSETTKSNKSVPIANTKKDTINIFFSLARLLLNESGADSFDKEFIPYTKNFIDTIHLSLNSDFMDPSNQKKFEQLTKDFSSDKKTAISLENVVHFLKSLNQKKETEEENFNNKLSLFFEELGKNKTIEVLMVNFEKRLFNLFLKQSKVPDEISRSITVFTDDLDFVTLTSSVFKYILTSMNVTEDVELHLDEILNSVTLDEVLYKFCRIVTLYGNLGESNSFFQEYLKDQNNTMFFEKLKMSLSSYEIPKEFLDSIFHILEKNQPLDQYKAILKLTTTSYIPKIFLNAIDQANSTLLIKFLSLILNEESEYFQTTKVLLSNEMRDIEKVKKVYKIFLKSKYVSLNNIQDFNKMEEFLTEIFLDDQDIPKKIKLLGLDYHKKLKILLKERLSSDWFNRLVDLINKFEKRLIDIDVLKLSTNATLEILKFVERIHQDTSLFVGDKLGNYLYEDIFQLLKGLLSRTTFNGEDGHNILMRLSIDLNEKLLFTLRLSKQFSETELKYFTQNFVKNNQIDYYKVYQSIWEGKFASKDNINYVSELLNGLEQYLLDESIKWTGNYSLANTISNLISIIQSVNHSDVNMFIDHYKQIDSTDLSNSTIEYISMFLHILGQVEIGNKSIDFIIYEYIPKLMHFSKTASDFWDSSLSKYITQLGNGKHIVNNGFQYLKDHLKKQKHNKFIKFLIEVLVPGVDGLLALVEEHYPKLWRIFDDHHSACLNLLKNLETNETLQHGTIPVINYVNGKSESNTTACNILKHLGIIIRLKKDDMFLDKVLNKMHNIVLKLFDEAKEEAVVSRTMGIALFTALKNTNFKSKLMLHNITLNFIVSFLPSINYFQAYQSLSRFHQQYLSLEKQDILNIIKSYFVTRFQHLKTISVDNFLRQNVPFAIKSTKNHLKHLILLIMRKIDKTKVQFSNQPFVINPVSYIKNIPKTIFDQLSENIRRSRTTHTHHLHILEGKVWKTHQLLTNKMAKKVDLVQELIEKLRSSSKQLVHETVSQNNLLLENIINSSANHILDGNLKQKLEILSNITRNLKSQKLESKQFLHDNLTNKFNFFMIDMERKFIDAEDLKLIRKSFEYLLMDFKQFAKQLIYPQVAYVFTYLDRNICQIKMNISQIYKEENDSYLFIGQKSYDSSHFMTAIYQQFKILRVLRTTAETIGNINKEFLGFRTVHKLLDAQLEPTILNFISKMDDTMKTQIELAHIYYGMLYPYIIQRPELIIGEGLKVYQRQLTRIALVVNKVIAIKPLSQLEAYTGKFLRVAFGKKKATIFAPIPRTAYLFTKSLITFDGKAIFFPSDFQSKKCIFLLARDFLWKRFSIYIKANTFIVDFNNSSVHVAMDTRKVHVYGTAHVIDLPVQINMVSVTRLPNLVKIEHAFGLVIYCRLDVFSCNITLSGYYHNKTLGLFGTNNVDHADDLRTPSGKLALNLIEFLNAFEMSKKCFVSDPSQIFSNKIAKIRLEKEGNCIEVFNQISQDNFMVKTAFLLACSIEDICLVASSFLDRPIEESKQPLNFPPVCETCRGFIKKTRYDQVSHTTINVHVTLLIKLVPEIEKGLKKLIVLAPRLQRELGSKYRLQFSVIGFGGRGLREAPHIQTGNGEVNMVTAEVEKALQNLHFVGEHNNKRLGLQALKFASRLEPELQSQFSNPTKIFILFDDDVSYTNSLLEIMEVHRSITKSGIILNVANNYRLERDVIGKDSFGMRYLNRLPKGEKHSTVQFPPPDDYMPLIKQSQGAVFALKAFVSNLPIWEKSWHIALSSSLQLQITRDRKLCKECDCHFCKNVKNEECEFDL